jgi:hypothetical protein
MATAPTTTTLDLSKGLTAEVCQTELERWMECSAAIAQNQSYRIGDYEYRRPDLDKVLAMIAHWNGMMTVATGRAGPRTKVIRRGC